MMADSLARRDGVNRTATALHLDGSKLKQLMGAAPGKGYADGLCGIYGTAVGQPPRMHD